MNPEQLIVIGVLATALTFILRVLATYANLHLGRFLANVLLFVVAAVLAVAWTHPQLPPFSGDIAAYLLALIQLAGPVFMLASMIYNALYDKVVIPLWARFAKS